MDVKHLEINSAAFDKIYETQLYIIIVKNYVINFC